MKKLFLSSLVVWVIFFGGALSVQAEEKENSSLFSTQMSDADAKAFMARPFSLSYGAYSKNYFDTEQGLNVAATHMQIDFGNIDLESVSRQLGLEKAADKQILFQADLQFSITPFVLAASTERKLDQKLDDKLAELRPQVAGMVTHALDAKPGFSSLPAVVQQGIIAKTTNDQISAIRQAQAESIKGKVRELEVETSIQQVVIGIGRVIQDGEAVVFISAGKLKVNGGASVDINGQSDINNLRPTNSRVGEQGSTADTGAIEIGYSKLIDSTAMGPARVTVAAYFFHDRLPFVNGAQYIGGVASKNDADFKRHKNFHQIDSALLKFMVETRTVDLYVSLGSYNGKGAVSGGVNFRVTPRDEIIIMGYVGDRENMSSGIAGYYSHYFLESKSLATYVGIERAMGLDDPTINAQGKFNQTEVLGGICYRFKDGKWLTDKRVYLEGFFDNNQGLVGSSHEVCGARIGFSAWFGHRKH